MKTKSVGGTGKSVEACCLNWRLAPLLVLIACLACPSLAGPFQLVSVLDPSQGPPAGGSGDSWAPVVSPDGRYVLFASTANNLVVTGTTNPLPVLFPPKLNVFLRDRTNGTTTLVSVNLSGAGGGNGDSWASAISTNGRYALFESSASDLVPSDTNNLTDVFVRDLVAGTSMLVTVSTNGGSANGVSRSSVMTPDGRYVAFVSSASNLVPGDTNGIPDVFVRDLQAHVTTLASVGATTTTPPSGSGISVISSESPDITSDGHYVAFYSSAINLVTGVQKVGDIYIRDLVGSTTVWASTYARTAVQSTMGAANAVSFNHALSDDGQYVAYEARPFPVSSTAAAGLILRYRLQTGLTDLVNTNANAATAAYEDIHSLDMTPDGRFIAFIANTNGTSGTTTCAEVWDGQTGATTLASGDLSNDVPTGSTCDWPTINPSGRFVAFLSSAINLVTNPVAGDSHLYVRDLQSAATALVDADTNGIGSPINAATAPRLSADGRFVAFECPDAGLVPNDRNHDYDVFVRDLSTGAAELISARDALLPSLSPNGSSFLSPLCVSTNGRYLAFASDADNLVPNNTNGFRNIFVRDLLLSTNFLVSVGTNGVGADGLSTDAAISGDGRYVAFTSGADNLVPGDNNKALDVFVRDLQAGTTALVSVKTGGGGPATGSSYSPWLSADGRYVLFRSTAANLASGSFSGENLFLRDLQSSTTYALSTSGYAGVAMTRDGRYVAFGGATGNVYVWDSQAAAKVYTKTTAVIGGVGISPDGNRLVYSLSAQLYAVDRAANTTWTIGSIASGSHVGLRFSGNGEFLAYAAPLSTTNQIYLYDLQYKTNLLVSQGYNSGGAAYGASDSPDVSAEGRFVAYRSAASNIVPGATNGVPNVFLYDRLSSTTTLLSASRLGMSAADNRSLAPVFSADAQTLVFQSWASDIIAQDFNYSSDVFAFSLYSSSPIPLFSASLVPGASPEQGPWIIWPVLPGKTYSVQFKNTLSDALWQPLNGSVTVVGNQAYLNDPSPGSGPRFYRVTAQ
jgi:Tol biopolymer transport system component